MGVYTREVDEKNEAGYLFLRKDTRLIFFLRRGRD
jgi:hypothetical protein